MRVWRTVLAAGLLVLSCGGALAGGWTADERAVLRSLWIGSLPPLPPDPSNRVADNPDAARLGHRLFFDRRLSANGRVDCASCHRPEWAFTDGFRLAEGVATAARNTMTLLGAAYSPWFFWDGRKDSQWAQALGPLENPVEMGTTRARVFQVLRHDEGYRRTYARLFGALPDKPDGAAISRAFANVGKALEAYQRRIVPGPSRFDRYVAALLKGDSAAAGRELSGEEIAGLRLFIGKAACARCHNGPLFTDFSFHDTGVPDAKGKWADHGRQRGAQLVLSDEFNCFSGYSDAKRSDCAELAFIRTDDPHFRRGFKTPTLRNVSLTNPYMHAGQFATLAQVIDHYNRAPRQPVGDSELRPLGLDADQRHQLEAFLHTLESPPVAPPGWLQRPKP